jgi:hypothetical protein
VNSVRESATPDETLERDITHVDNSSGSTNWQQTTPRMFHS